MSKKPLKIYSSYTLAVDAHPGKIILQVGRRAFLVGDFDDLGLDEITLHTQDPAGKWHMGGHITLRHLDRLGNGNHATAVPSGPSTSLRRHWAAAAPGERSNPKLDRELSAKEAPPVVGMGATMVMHSDRHACTVIEVVSPSKVVVQLDHAVRTDKNGLSESQTYEYAPNPHGEIHTLTKRLNGKWITKGQSLRSGQRWYVGVRQEYRDPSF